MRWEIATKPSVEPISLSDMKAHLRIEHSDDDMTINSLISVARQYFERNYALALLEQTVLLWLDRWPSSGDKSMWWDGVREGVIADLAGSGVSLLLAVRPLLSLTEVATYGQNDAKTIWDSTKYRTSGGLEPRLIKRDGNSWPMPGRSSDGISITYQAGFGIAAADVPLLITHGLKELVTHLYFNRGDLVEEASKVSGADTLWAPYKRVRL